MKRLLSLVVFLSTAFSIHAQSIQLDMAIGEQNAQEVANKMGIYQDEAKTLYLRKIGDRLVKQLEKPLFDYQFHLVPELSPNAFALPGGYVYVTTGLLAILQSEDELACILGHEIIHANNRHAVKQMKKSILPKMLEIPGNLIGAFDADLGTIFNTPIVTSNTMLFASYSRSFETEADSEGIMLAAKAGYDPAAMKKALTRLSKTVEAATGMVESKSYFNDHPLTSDRVDQINKDLKRIEITHSGYESKSFLLEFDHTVFGDDPRQGVIKENKFIHPELAFSMDFPLGWSIENQASNVTGYSPDGKAALIVAVLPGITTAKQEADKFVANLDKNYQEMMVSAEEYSINNRNGYLITFKDETGPEEMYGYVYWMSFNDLLFQFIGITPKASEKKIDDAAESFRSTSKEDLKGIEIQYLEVVKAKKGEDILRLSKRTKNVLNPELTAMINDKKLDQKLKEGEYIKVVRSYHIN